MLWRFQTGAGADAPVATYEVNGEQYIAVLAGGNSSQLSARGDSLWGVQDRRHRAAGHGTAGTTDYATRYSALKRPH